MVLSAWLMLRDFRTWLRGRHDVSYVPDEWFAEKAKALIPEPGSTLCAISGAAVTFDDEVNRVLNAIRTPVAIHEGSYALPKSLAPFQTHALRFRRPTMNERKIRLASDINIDTISVGRAAELQRTSYFLSVASNELAGYIIEQVDRTQRNIESLSLFDLYVANGRQLRPLSQSMLSNHIGVTSLVVTGDDCIVLQWQGSTQVDSNKVNAGASGSADWDDIEALRRLSGTRADPSLQEIVRYAMEREVREELGAATGSGHSRTTITGFARYVHRGGKPEFFGITWLAQDFDSLAIPRAEEKWVRVLRKRLMDGGSPALLLKAIEKLEDEFDPGKTAQASISMALALRFAREFLAANPSYRLRPDAG
jgi:hypothetical protein